MVIDGRIMKGQREREPSGSAGEGKKKKVEKDAGESCDESLEIATMKRPEPGDARTLDRLADLRWMFDDLMEMG